MLLPPFKRLLPFLLLTLLASLARAEYKATIAGGTWQSTGAAGTAADANPPSAGGSLSHGASTGGGFKNAKGVWFLFADYGTCRQEGELTATLTWDGPVGTEPAGVVVKEAAAAAWSGNSGACDSGLGGTKSPTTHGETQTGVRYTVFPSPAHSFTVKCAPSASAVYTTAFPDDPTDVMGGSASVSYSVETFPVTIALSGGKDGAGKEFLVGQRCVASVALPSGWTATAPPSPSTASAYAWSPGGSADPFKSFTYVPRVSAPAGGSGSGHRFDLTAGDKDDPTLTCCFAKAGTGTVSVTVRTVGPDGTVLSVSASKDATVRLPIAPTPDVKKGKAQFDSDTIHVADANGNTSNARGITWTSLVTTQPEYGGGGRWGWVQLLQESTTRVVGGVTQTLEFGNSSSGWFTFGADGTLPSSVWDGAVDGQNFFYADGTQGKNWDAPAEFLDASASSYHVEERFSDWLMYCPPGTGSQFVPLYKFTWFLVGDASHTPPHDSVPGGPWTASGLAHDNTAVEPNPAFPDWSHELTNGVYRWRNP